MSLRDGHVVNDCWAWGYGVCPEREQISKHPTHENNHEFGKFRAQCGRKFGVRVTHFSKMRRCPQVLSHQVPLRRTIRGCLRASLNSRLCSTIESNAASVGLWEQQCLPGRGAPHLKSSLLIGEGVVVTKPLEFPSENSDPSCVERRSAFSNAVHVGIIFERTEPRQATPQMIRSVTGPLAIISDHASILCASFAYALLFRH